MTEVEGGEETRFRRVATERMDDVVAGLRYGMKPRILMRSPTHILYVALGVHLVPRGARAMQHVQTVARQAKREALSSPAAREIIIAAFGAGSDDAAITALTTRGGGTVLVDGGGDAIILIADRVAAQRAEYEAASPDARALLEVTGTCRQCGGELEPVLDRHHFDTIPVVGQPRTIEDCGRMSNRPVMSVHGYGVGSPREWWGYVSWFSTWDGESYRDPLFCTDACAARYGRRAATELPALAVGGTYVPEPQATGQHVSHRTTVPTIHPGGLRT